MFREVGLEDGIDSVSGAVDECVDFKIDLFVD